MTTLIVGCGYLGRRVARLLADDGETVYGTTRSAARAQELAEWGAIPLVADVLDPVSLSVLPNADTVLYCVGFDRSMGVPMRTVYVEGLRNVLYQLRATPLRFVYASSTGVYGQDDGGWVDEESPAVPRHESGRVCLEAEGVVRASALPNVILRFSGLYGPGRIMRRTSLLNGEEIPGSPEKYLNLTHIDDAARAAVAALSSDRVGRIYLVSDDRPVERREFYERAARKLGAPSPRFRPPKPGSPEATREEANKRISNRRMRAELCPTLIYPDIAEGIVAAIDAERGDCVD